MVKFTVAAWYAIAVNNLNYVRSFNIIRTFQYITNAVRKHFDSKLILYYRICFKYIQYKSRLSS